MTTRTRPLDHAPSWATSIPEPGDIIASDVEEFLIWLAIEKNRPKTTVRTYRYELAKLLGFCSAHMSVSAPISPHLNRELLHQYQIELASLIPNPRSRAHALVAVRQFLKYAYDNEWTAQELSRQITIPRYVTGDPHPIPTELLPHFLRSLPMENLRDLRDRALIYFLIATGCRISEACAVNRTDLRPEGFRVLGKGGKYRTVYCTGDALAATQAYLQARGHDASVALFINVATNGSDHGKVSANNRLTTDGARKALQAMRKRVSTTPELADLMSYLRSPHAARHTTATTLLEATNGDVRLVQEVLGHATLETLKVYTEITDKRKRTAYRKLETYLHDMGTVPGHGDD